MAASSSGTGGYRRGKAVPVGKSQIPSLMMTAERSLESNLPWKRMIHSSKGHYKSAKLVGSGGTDISRHIVSRVSQDPIRSAQTFYSSLM